MGGMIDKTILVADVGGTKSELAVFPQATDSASLLQRRYVNSQYANFNQVVGAFLKEYGQAVPHMCCVAVAGVVTGGRATLTNLPWEISEEKLLEDFGFNKACLINDLTAVSSSLMVLASDDLLELQPGSNSGNDQGGEVKGIVAPGTGLGQGLLVSFQGNCFVRGSEGGHCDFGPTDEEQVALLSWMRTKEEQVSYESLIAGPGFANLYDFCKEYHQLQESPWIAENMCKAKDRTPIIVSGVTGERKCTLCEKVIALFLTILGSEAGNLALKLYARGGLYLGGGILPRLVGHVSFDGFLQSFHKKGLMSDFMKEIPVYLILRRDAALIGAFYFGRQQLAENFSDDGTGP